MQEEEVRELLENEKEEMQEDLRRLRSALAALAAALATLAALAAVLATLAALAALEATVATDHSLRLQQHQSFFERLVEWWRQSAVCIHQEIRSSSAVSAAVCVHRPLRRRGWIGVLLLRRDVPSEMVGRPLHARLRWLRML